MQLKTERVRTRRLPSVHDIPIFLEMLINALIFSLRCFFFFRTPFYLYLSIHLFRVYTPLDLSAGLCANEKGEDMQDGQGRWRGDDACNFLLFFLLRRREMTG